MLSGKLLEKLYDARKDERKKAILGALFEFHYGSDENGLLWGKLLESAKVTAKKNKSSISRQTFSNRLTDLQDLGLVEKERIMNQRGNPILYRINPKLYAALIEISEMINLEYIEHELENFEKEIVQLDTEIYVEAMMEVALSRLSVLSIALMLFETEAAWVFFEQNYQNLELILRYIVKRASRSKKDKELVMNKLFEILKPYSERPIGKRFNLNEVYNAKEDIIRRIVKEE